MGQEEFGGPFDVFSERLYRYILPAGSIIFILNQLVRKHERIMQFLMESSCLPRYLVLRPLL
jgi:hypothetical protein